MSNKKQHRQRLLDHEFAMWFNLRKDDNALYRCCLAMSDLNQAEQDRISENIQHIALDFFDAIKPYLDVASNDEIVSVKAIDDPQESGVLR